MPPLKTYRINFHTKEIKFSVAGIVSCFRADIFVFLLSTRAGGLGINLTAADTVSNLILTPLSVVPCTYSLRSLRVELSGLSASDIRDNLNSPKGGGSGRRVSSRISRSKCRKDSVCRNHDPVSLGDNV